MGYQLTKMDANVLFSKLSKTYDIFAPVVKKGDGCFSDIDVVRYDKVTSVDEIEWNKKSDYSFKESLLHINETLFYFTEDKTIVPNGPEKELLIFMRACDFHALKRLDEIYLNNKFSDFYYARVREKAKFALIGCETSCLNGFCVSMNTNKTDAYSLYVKVDGETVSIDVKDEASEKEINTLPFNTSDVCVDYVKENYEKVTLPKNINPKSDLWKEYGSRCINCGRCNFVCPTCTCFTMQDIFYKDNARVGERRRVWASCQIGGYTQIAGGHEFRKDNSDKIRFKVMHKVQDYEKRFGYPMCVGCGRCIDVCPEYIAYSNLLNKLSKEEQ